MASNLTGRRGPNNASLMAEPHDDLARQRDQHVRMVVESSAPRKLVVAGPGTGKTHTFKELLRTRPEPRVALTFIRSLAQELEVALEGVAQVNTFHGYSKHVLYRMPVEGLTTGCHYYPPLHEVIVLDMLHVDDRVVDDQAIARAMINLDDPDGLVDRALELGTYYNAVGHVDAVYRVFRHFEGHPADVPALGQLVVDEYQDFNLLEVRFLEQLSQNNPVLICGDDDQALYGWKGASPRFLRELAEDPAFEAFELPYCSRCTQVIVEAVARVVMRARQLGLLEGRIDKPYLCYLPDKGPDSEAFPKIIHASCSVDRKSSPYMARYVEGIIRGTDEGEIADAIDHGRLPFLVLGPGHIAEEVYEYLADRFEGVFMRRPDTLQVNLLDGYLLVKRDPESRLGWRIICHCAPPAAFPGLLAGSFADDRELRACLPEEYVASHERIVALLDKLELEGPDPDEAEVLQDALGLGIDELLQRLHLEPGETDDVAPQRPMVRIANLLGAKGLEADHVFVLGVSEGIFPQSDTPTETEVCELLVALTRSRRSLHLVSAGNWKGTWMRRSVFLYWLEDLLEPVTVNKDYFA